MTGEHRKVNKQWAAQFRNLADKLDAEEIHAIKYTMYGDPRDICADGMSTTYYDGGERSLSFTYYVPEAHRKSFEGVFK